MEYFNHDSAAGGDDKIIALRLECGGAAVDAYWVVLEQIYRDETALDIFGNQHVLRSVCHRLATDAETLKKAQVEPEKYANLQIRVCGWNVRFVELPKCEQDAYIRRAENIAE